MLRGFYFFIFLQCAICTSAFSQSGSVLPLPDGPQLRWQRYEQTMFVHFCAATWQGREKDNHSTPLNRINPELLNTDQWCETAISWGAKMIVFVAKHTGGFCLWQTNTTRYGIKDTPWREGKGDVLKDLSESCRKYGLGLGVYVYPGDHTWGAGIGSGGITSDPSKQEAYNKVFRQQLTEVLTNYGPMQEVWFDGSCKIKVDDILHKYASDAVIFQGPLATIRWVGSEVPFLNLLPNTKKHIFFASKKNMENRFGVLRDSVHHLQSGGVLVFFGSGHRDPDPAVHPFADQAINNWLEVLEIFLTRIKDIQLQPVIVSGIVTPQWAHHPITRLRRKRIDQHRLAEFGQVISQLLHPGNLFVRPAISFGKPAKLRDLQKDADDGRVMSGIIKRERDLLLTHIQEFGLSQTQN